VHRLAIGVGVSEAARQKGSVDDAEFFALQARFSVVRVMMKRGEFACSDVVTGWAIMRS
jgi:hypothetical protein